MSEQKVHDLDPGEQVKPLDAAARAALFHAHRHAGELDRGLNGSTRDRMFRDGLVKPGIYGFELTVAGRARARAEFAAEDAAWDPPAEPAAGQVWRCKGDERHDVKRDMRVEAVDESYCYVRGVLSGRQSRIRRGTGHRTGPVGYRLLDAPLHEGDGDPEDLVPVPCRPDPRVTPAVTAHGDASTAPPAGAPAPRESGHLRSADRRRREPAVTGTVPAEVRPSPCRTCPYRRNVLSGLWAASEYGKLPWYDGPLNEQPERLFTCHHNGVQVCAGWFAHRGDPRQLLAVLLAVARGALSPAAFEYTTRVPLFPSGAAAAEHGLRDIAHPGPAALRAIAGLLRAHSPRVRKPSSTPR